MKKKMFLLKVLENLKGNQNNSNWRGNLTTWIKCWRNKSESNIVIKKVTNEKLIVWKYYLFYDSFARKNEKTAKNSGLFIFLYNDN